MHAGFDSSLEQHQEHVVAQRGLYWCVPDPVLFTFVGGFVSRALRSFPAGIGRGPHGMEVRRGPAGVQACGIGPRC